MNQITTTNPTPSLEPRLRSLLVNNSGWAEGVPTRWEPPKSLSPMERQAVEGGLATLRRSLVPASRAEIVATLLRLRQHFPERDRPEGVWQSVIADYAVDLAEYPAEIVEAGATDYRRNGKWWPKVSELRERMEPLLTERKNMLVRAEKLAAGAPEKRERYAPTAEERKRFADGFRKAADELRNITPQGPEAA